MLYFVFSVDVGAGRVLSTEGWIWTTGATQPSRRAICTPGLLFV